MKNMDNFKLARSIEILERTPATLKSLLGGLSDKWIYENEGDESWSPFINVGHLIHGEKTDWIPRIRIILQHGESRPFDPFDRFAQFSETKNKNLNELLEEFQALREKNIQALNEMDIKEKDLSKTGIHPDLGRVTLKQLIATWVVHDLGHIRQIARVMAKQYKVDVGPWEKYLPVLHE